MDIKINGRVNLNNGAEMPLFGLGVIKAGPGAETRNAFRYALGASHSLVRGQKFDDPAIRQVPASCRKSPAQTPIRWSLQHGRGVIPKSVIPERNGENAAGFDRSISPAGLARRDGLTENLRITRDLTDVF